MHLPWRVKALAARAATFSSIHPRDAMMFIAAFASLSIRGPEVAPVCFRAAVALASQPDAISSPSALVEVLAALASLQARKIPLVNKVLLPRLTQLPESTDAKTLQRAVLAVLRLYRPGQSTAAVAVCDRLVGLCVRSYVHNPTDFALIAGAMALLPNTSAFVSPQGPDGRPQAPAVPLPTSFDAFSDLPLLQSVLAARNAGPLFFTETTSSATSPLSSWSDKPLLAAAWLVHQATACHLDEIRRASGNVVYQLLHMFLVLPYLREAIRNTLHTHANGNHRVLSHVRGALWDVDRDCILFTTTLGVTRCVPGGFASFVHAHLARMTPSRATVPFLKRILAAMTCPVFAKAFNSYDVAKLADAVLGVPSGQWRSIAKLRFATTAHGTEADQPSRSQIVDESGAAAEAAGGTAAEVRLRGKDVMIDVVQLFAKHVQYFAHSSLQRRLPQDVVVSCAVLRAVVHITLCIDQGSVSGEPAADAGSTASTRRFDAAGRANSADPNLGSAGSATNPLHVWESTVVVLQHGFSRSGAWTTHNLLWAYLSLAGVARRMCSHAAESDVCSAAVRHRSLTEAIAGVSRELSLRFSNPSASRDTITVQQCVQALHSTASILCCALGRSGTIGDPVDHHHHPYRVSVQETDNGEPWMDHRDNDIDGGDDDVGLREDAPSGVRSPRPHGHHHESQPVALPLEDTLKIELCTVMCTAILQHPSMEVVLNDFGLLTPVDRASLQRSIAALYKCIHTNNNLDGLSGEQHHCASMERVLHLLERFSVAFLNDCVAHVPAAGDLTRVSSFSSSSTSSNTLFDDTTVAAARDSAESAVDTLCSMCVFLDVKLCAAAAITLIRGAVAALLLVSQARPSHISNGSSSDTKSHVKPDGASQCLPPPRYALTSDQLERLLNHMCRYQSILFLPEGEQFAASRPSFSGKRSLTPVSTASDTTQRPAATILRFDVQRLWHLHSRHAFFSGHRSGEHRRSSTPADDATRDVSRYHDATRFCQSLQWLSNLGFSLHPGPIPAEVDCQVLKQRRRSSSNSSTPLPRKLVEIPVKYLAFSERDEVVATPVRSEAVGGGLALVTPTMDSPLPSVVPIEDGQCASVDLDSRRHEEESEASAVLRLSPAHVAQLTATILHNRHVQRLDTEFAVWCAMLTGPLARSIPHLSAQAVIVLCSALLSEQLVRRCIPRIADCVALLHRAIELLDDTQLSSVGKPQAEDRQVTSDLSWSPRKVLLIDVLLHSRVLDVLLAGNAKSLTVAGDASTELAGAQRRDLVQKFVQISHFIIADERVSEQQRVDLRVRLARWEGLLAKKK